MKSQAGLVPIELPRAEAFIRGESTLTVVCDEPMDEVTARLDALLTANDMAIVHKHDLAHMLSAKEVPIDCRCLIYEVFPAALAGKLLALDIGLAHLLPLRLTVHDRDGVVVVSTPMPTVLMTEFSHTVGVARLAGRFEAALMRVLLALR